MRSKLLFRDSAQPEEVCAEPNLFDVGLMPILSFYLLHCKLLA